MKKLNKKGFTLAELLIVVAIIAVLVAISIPIFSSQLEKSREAVDAANIRAAYAEVMTSALTDDTTTTSVTKSTDGKTYSKDVTLKQKKEGWQTTIEWPADLTGADAVESNTKATVSYNVDTGKATVTYSK